MKLHFVPACLAATLSGCAVVSPYDQPYATYYPAPYYSQPYATAPGYVIPAPVYEAPVYVGPPVQFGFGLNYRSGGGRHGHGFDGHDFRHGHYGGFGGHGYYGGRGNWRR
jgi:hypothetical protein